MAEREREPTPGVSEVKAAGSRASLSSPHPIDPADTAKAERRRLFRLLRIGVPTGTVLIVVVALFWPQLIGQRSRIDIAVPPAAIENSTQPEAVVNATYSGMDRAGRPFEIRARSVRNPPGEQQTLQLTQPDAQIALKDGTMLTIAAATGLFRRDGNQLDLQGDVTLRRGPDLTVRTDEATIHLADSTASGQEAVNATSAQGTLSGTGFRISDGGDTVFVTGPARMRVDEHAADPGRP